MTLYTSVEVGKWRMKVKEREQREKELRRTLQRNKTGNIDGGNRTRNFEWGKGFG